MKETIQLEPILQKGDIVKYLMTAHELMFDREISRIKLQKSLYFLYAFWIQERSKMINSEVSDQIEDLSSSLFQPNFEAWGYGPVDPDVYNDHKNNRLENFSEEDMNSYIDSVDQISPFVNSFLFSITKRSFNTTDFSLVDLSHKDECWIKNYDESNPRANKQISHRDIFIDYNER